MSYLQNTHPVLFDFFEATPDLVCIAGRDGYFKRVNPAVTHKLEYTAEELYIQPISSFMHPDDVEHTLNRREELLAGKALLNFTNRYITKSGAVIWLEWTSIYSAEQEVVFAIAKEITARKLAEQQVEEEYRKFKSLATHFKSSIEKDRKSLTYELHEELAQLVSAVKMDIDWIAHKAPALDDLSRSKVEHALAVSGMIIRSIQRISFSLSPLMLTELGLNATMEWLCKEFSILNNIPCNFINTYDEQALNDEIKTDFFRICQEALNNIAEHADAVRVDVCIENKGDMIQLQIIDNGKGFDMQEVLTGGLLSMRERAASINGQLQIETNLQKGTIITVMVPKG